MRPAVSFVRQGLVFLAFFLCLLVPCAAHAGGPSALVLDDAQGVVDPWPALTVWTDAAPDASVDDARHARFETPRVPRGSFGLSGRPLWLKLPLVSQGDGHWVVQADFAALDHVDAWLFAGDRLVSQAHGGDQVPAEQQPIDALTPSWRLALEPGVPHVLLVRVSSSSPLVVPLRLVRPDTYNRLQDDRLLVQGLMIGIALALAIYALTQWLYLHDAMFGWYGLTTLSGTLYALAYYGVGARHLWGYAHWWNDNAAQIAALAGGAAAAMLADRLIDVAGRWPGLSRLLRALALLSVLTILLRLTGLASQRQAQGVASLLVALPALVSLPLCWRRWRDGDGASLFMLVGWSAFVFTMLPMVLMLRGLVAADDWLQNGTQLGRIVGMLAWLRVLAMRIADVRRRAEQAEHRHRELHVLAHADPLTGLPNRRGFDVAIQTALQRAHADRRVAVFVGDLDGFKAVNDRLGHEAGDELLVAAARRLRAKVRRDDIVARLGGDEFVVIAEGLPTEDDARPVGRQLVDAFTLPFVVRGEAMRVGLTLGYAVAPLGGCSAAELLRRADEAMYAGKRAGKSQLVRGEPLAAG